MSKHWKDYLPNDPKTKTDLNASIPRTLDEAAELSGTLRGLINERKELEDEIRTLSHGNREKLPWKPAAILNIDRKRKNDKDWERKRKRQKSPNGFVNMIEKKERKKQVDKKTVNRLTIASKKVAKDQRLKNEMIDGSKTHRDGVDRFKITTKDAQGLGNDSNLEVKFINKVIDKAKQASEKLNTVEKVFKRAKEQQNALKRHVKKVDTSMKNEVIDRIKKKSGGTKQESRFSLNDAMQLRNDIVRVKELTDEWMSKRDIQRKTRKSKTGFNV